MAPDARVGLNRVRRSGGAVGRLTLLVLGWWLILAAVAVQTLPSTAASAPKVGSRAQIGQATRINLPGMPSLPIPVERAAFDEFQRGVAESDEDAMDHAFNAYEWISVSHHLAVRVVAIDGEVVNVEILEGRYAGRRGWLKHRQLSF